jgi:probable HAF family extracellular repeat protein
MNNTRAGRFVGLEKAAAAVVAFALVATSIRAQTFTVTDLGAFIPNGVVNPFGINDAGTIVGEAQNGPFHAFSYSNGVLTDLGPLGGNVSTAYGVNDSGTIVGTAYTASSGEYAFSYSGGVMTSLGSLGGTESQANAINGSGTIVGYSELSGNGTLC